MDKRHIQEAIQETGFLTKSNGFDAESLAKTQFLTLVQDKVLRIFCFTQHLTRFKLTAARSPEN